METTLKVEGMHCGACVNRVQGALEDAEGVQQAEVSLEAGEAWVRHEPDRASQERLRELVEGAGYQVRS